MDSQKPPGKKFKQPVKNKVSTSSLIRHIQRLYNACVTKVWCLCILRTSSVSHAWNASIKWHVEESVYREEITVRSGPKLTWHTWRGVHMLPSLERAVHVQPLHVSSWMRPWFITKAKFQGKLISFLNNAGEMQIFNTCGFLPRRNQSFAFFSWIFRQYFISFVLLLLQWHRRQEESRRPFRWLKAIAYKITSHLCVKNNNNMTLSWI